MSGPIRDDVVGAAVRELRVPEHRPGFWDDLEAALPARPRRRAMGPLRPRLGLALAAAAALAAVLVLALPRPQAPEPALAEVVKQRVRGALAGLDTLSGRAVYRARDPISGERTTRHLRFATTAAGDFRLTDLRGPADLAYDAEAGVERAINESASLGTGRFASIRRGVAPGPPDLGPSDWILNRRLGAAVRALLVARDPAVRETTYDGRAAWQLDLDVEPNAISEDIDRIQVTVDRATGIPVRVVTSLRGERHDALRIERLRVGDRLPPGTFDLRFPAGAEVGVTDEGFRRVDLDEAARIVPYAPLVPSEVPDGFRLADVAVAREAAPTGAEAANPRSRMVVSLGYRRGFDQFTVSTRLTGPDRARWDDPVAAGEGIREPVEPVRLERGALAGERGELVLGARSLPHLWVAGDRLVVTVAGDLGRDELLAVAGALEERP